MRKYLLVLLIGGFILMGMLTNLIAQEEAVVEEKVGFKVFNVYTDKWDRTNHYVAAGWMGDYNAIKMDDNSKDNPYSGTTCIKFTYSGKYRQGAGWAGVYWQNPANNWGYTKGGFDLTGATKLTFWARGKEGGEVIDTFKMGGISGEYPDSGSVDIGPITLTKEWKQYTMDLEGLDLSYISGGFCWTTSMLSNSENITFYLDDIKYE